MDNNFRTEIYEDILSIIIIGDQFVGKTSLMRRFSDNSFAESTLGTVGIECYKKIHIVDKSKYLIKIWDTCGQEQFRSLTANYFRNAEGVILAYDVTDGNSFESLKVWLNSLRENCKVDIPKVIIGNKIDYEGKVISSKQAKAFAEMHKVKVFEASAKKNVNVNEAFDTLFKDIINVKKRKEKKNNSMRISFKAVQPSTRKCFC